MKTRKLVLNIVETVSLVLAIIGLFLNIWAMGIGGDYAGTGIFTSKDGLNCAWLGLICEITMIILVVALAVWALLFVLQLCNVKIGKLASINKLLLVVITVCTALILISGIAYSIAATGEMDVLPSIPGVDSPKMVFMPSVGYYFVAVAGIASTVVAFMDAKK